MNGAGIKVASLIGWVLLAVLVVSASGQATGTAGAAGTGTARAAGAYAGEPSVLLERSTVYRMAADGTGSTEYRSAMRVQSEAALKDYGVVTVAFAAGTQRVEFGYVRVRHGDGTVVETPLSAALEISLPVTQQAPFYSDLKAMQVPVRSLKLGDTLEWQAKVVQTRAEAPGQFWGQENFLTDGVVLAQTVELRTPKATAVKVWSTGPQAVVTEDGGERIYRWERSQLKPTVGAAAVEAAEAKKKQVWTAEQELEAREGRLPDVAWTTFPSWEAVGSWYRGLEGERMIPDAAVKAKVAELTAGKTTEEAKVRAVYGYVAGDIRYIGVAFGIGRYQPHTASAVLDNQYGDCKDKHTLLAAMLGALGLQADAVLIGAGIRFSEAVPSPAAFNHLITRVQVDGKPVWLDATAEVAPYGMLLSVIRDHQALVVPESGAAMVVRTPELPPFPVFQRMEAVGTLDESGTSNSRITLTVRGDDELALRAVLRQSGPAQYEALIQQMSQGLGYAGTTSHVEINSLEDTSQPLAISYDYKREKSGDWANRRVVPQVAPVSLYRPGAEDPALQTIALGVKRVETSTSAMKLPAGWGVELPEAIHQRSAYGTVDETYRFEKGTLYADRRLEVLAERVPVSEWKSYRKWIEASEVGNEQLVQLTHAGAEVKPVEADGAQAAPKLLEEAGGAIQRNDLERARTLLDQVKAAHETEPRLWAAYGYLEMRKGETTAALADWHKELTLHPESTQVYAMMVPLLIAKNQRGEAEDALGKWAAADETNTRPVQQLMGMLVEDGKAAQAVDAGEALEARLPEERKKEDSLQMQLGKAELAAGLTEKGRARLVALLGATESPEMMNDAAYELADARLELPLAESKARAGLERMEEESRSWTLDESPKTLARKTYLLEATWDTVGWILYREGKSAESEGFVKAAWRCRQSSAVGEHLGTMAVARGDRDAGLADYEMAEKLVIGYDQMGVRRPAGKDEMRLKEVIEVLRKAGARPATGDASARLQELRTFPLGKADGMDGTAEYRLLLGAGGVERAVATGSKTLAGGEERLKRAKLTELWPNGSRAQLVRTGMLNCHSGVCELVLEP